MFPARRDFEAQWRFQENYGKVLGAILYLRSVSAARGRSWFWAGIVSFACSVALAWMARHGWTI
jgi:hypothetical protein